MKLIGYTAQRARRGLFAVHMSLGPLTVLLGANDAGKSTLLRSLYEDLRGRPADEELSPSQDGGAIYAELTDEEIRGLVPADGLANAAWGLGGYRSDATPDLDLATSQASSSAPGVSLEEWIGTLRENTVSPPSFSVVLDQLLSSRIVCFEPVAQSTGRRQFLAYWCLPSLETLRVEVRDALKESKLERFAAGNAQRKGGLWFQTSRPRFFFGGVQHLHAEHAPVIVAPLSWNERVAPPEVLFTPASFDQIRQAITDSVAGVVADVRFGERDYVQDYEWSHELELERSAPRVWLERHGSGWRIDPVATGALALLRAQAQRLLPDFVGSRYEIELTFRPVDDWFDASPIELAVRRRGSRDSAFEPEDLADGFHLWLQLAFAGGLSAVDGLRAQLQTLGEWAGKAFNQSISVDTAAELDQEFSPSVLELAGAEIAAAATTPDPAMPSPVERSETQEKRFATFARRVVVADEPERHLHPRLQRKAAQWLGGLADDSAAQCVVASHAIAFLGVNDAVLNYVTRIDGKVIVESIDGTALDALDTVARDVGFNRGELLATVSCFLLVEGEHDRVTLEGIFGRELRAAGVFVVPLRGSPRRSLLDVDTLWRFMTAPVAVALDNLPMEDVAAAQADPDAIGKLRQPKATEEAKAVATIIRAAHGTDKRVEFLGHAEVDLIDTLEDDAIRDEFPRWPGQQAMRIAWETYRAQHQSSARSRKAWLEKTYGLPNDTGTYIRLAAAHLRLGLRPAALATIVEAAVRLALEYRALDALLEYPPSEPPDPFPAF